MVLRKSILILSVLLLSIAPAYATPCPGFEAAMMEIEAALPPVQPPVVLIPPHG